MLHEFGRNLLPRPKYNLLEIQVVSCSLNQERFLRGYVDSVRVSFGRLNRLGAPLARLARCSIQSFGLSALRSFESCISHSIISFCLACHSFICPLNALKQLCQAIGNVHLGVNLSDFDILVNDKISNMMILHLYVLHLCMVD